MHSHRNHIAKECVCLRENTNFIWPVIFSASHFIVFVPVDSCTVYLRGILSNTRRFVSILTFLKHFHSKIILEPNL